MGVSIIMSGSGTVGDIQPDWSVEEAVTPVALDDTTGSTGAVSLNAVANSSSKFIIDNTAIFTSDAADLEPGATALGSINGYIDDVSITGSSASFDINTLVNLLNVTVNAPAQAPNSLSQIIANYVALVTGAISVSYTATNNPTRTYPSWTDNLWSNLKVLAAIERVELAVIGTSLVVRDLGTNVLVIDDDTNVTQALSNAATGTTIELTYQNSVFAASAAGGITIVNYDTNPSVETTSAGWVASGTAQSPLGAPNITLAARTNFKAYKGTQSYLVQFTESAEYHYTAQPIPFPYQHSGLILVQKTVDISSIPAHTNISASIAGFLPTVSGAIKAQAGIALYFLNGSGAVISTNNPGLNYAPAQNAWTTINSNTVSVPSGAVTVTVNLVFGYVRSAAASSAALTGIQYFFDAAKVAVGPPSAYVDGNSGAGYSWAGTANNSASQFTYLGSGAFYDALLDNNTSYTVNAGEVSTTTIQTNNYAVSLAQPIQSPVYPVPVGYYFVSGSDNLPIVPAEWAAYGGKVSVAIGETPGTIDLTLTGPLTDIPSAPGPYSLAVSDGENAYAQLKIAGTGVLTTPQTLELLTGANPATTTNVIAASINSPFLSDITSAYNAGVWSSVFAAGPVETITFSLPTARLQGFGLSAGAIVRYKDAMFRIATVNIGKAISSFTATWYTTIGMYNTTFPSQTIGQANTIWAGFSVGDHKIAPLKAS